MITHECSIVLASCLQAACHSELTVQYKHIFAVDARLARSLAWHNMSKAWVLGTYGSSC